MQDTIINQQSAPSEMSVFLAVVLQVRAFVEQVIDIVDLTDLSFNLVGAPGAAGGLSMEQMKRLTIAVELVANPSVVFMDEPTSGMQPCCSGFLLLLRSWHFRPPLHSIYDSHEPSAVL